jgi:hypothetical protein
MTIQSISREWILESVSFRLIAGGPGGLIFYLFPAPVRLLCLPARARQLMD